MSSFVVTGENQQAIMQEWIQQEQDFCITGHDIEMCEPWKNWLSFILPKFGDIVKDFIAIGHDYEWLTTIDPSPNPFIVFLFPHKPEIEEVRQQIWDSFKDIHNESLMLMGGPLDLTEFMDQIPDNRSIKVLITTPWLFEKFVAVGKISTSWIRLLICYNITNAINPTILAKLTNHLLHPGTRTSIMISKSYGIIERAVAQGLLKPDHHVVYLPYRSMIEGSDIHLLQHASTWISSRPRGEKILVICGSIFFCNKLAKSQTSDGQQIQSSQTNFGHLFNGLSYRSFNHGQCKAIAIPVDEIKNIDIRKVDVIFNLGMSATTWILTLHGSARGIINDNPPPQ